MIDRVRVSVLVAFLAVLIAACNLGGVDREEAIDATPPPTEALTVPEVVINSPLDGAEFIINEPLFVTATITDSVGVSTVQLLANGQPVRTVGVEETDNRQFQPVLDFTPRTTGALTLGVIAYRGSVASEQATVQVTVRSSAAAVTATPILGGNQPIIDPNDPNCRALVNTGLNFRRGPGTTFDIIRTLGAGEVLQAVGRLPDNSWWQLSDRTGTRGWVSAQFITLYDGRVTLCRNVNIIQPPATATPQATATPPPSATPTATHTATPTRTATPSAVPLPDLRVSNVFCPSELVIPAGETDVTAEFSFNITNSGGAVDQQFSARVRVVNGDTFDAGTYSGLAGGQTLSATVDITIAQTGEVAVIFAVDPDNEITESDETNNERTCTVTVTNE